METAPFIVTSDLLASKGQRLINFLLDLLFITIINASVFAALSIIADVTDNYDLSGWFEAHSKVVIETWFLVAFGYYGLTEWLFSRTLAKYITKTIVVMKDGSRLNSKGVIRRTLCRLIFFEAFTFLGVDARGWHDSFSDTYVVKKHRFNHKQGHVPFYG